MQIHPFPDDMCRAIVESIDRGDVFALATVLKDAGSTPQGAGAKAMIDANGSIRGTIGGGRLEAQAIELAVGAVRSLQPAVFEMAFAGSSVDDCRPICGGVMRVMIDPAVARHRAAYAAAAEARRQRNSGVLITTVRNTAPPQVNVEWFAEGAIPQDVGFPGLDVINSVLTRSAPESFVEALPQAAVTTEAVVEPVLPTPQLIIVGGGHVAQAVALQAGLVGFELVLIEDRPEFARAELFPDIATIRCGDSVATLNEFTIDPHTFIVLLNRGHRYDADALAACIHKPAAYVGMIGSRRKVALVREAFLASGTASAEELDRIHAPIGLDIGAQSVPEIATSIVAELIAVRRTGQSPQSLRMSRTR